MANENDLIKKLMVSKQIMEKHNSIPRSGQGNISIPNVETYEAPPAKYNLPQDMMNDVSPQKISTPQVATKDRIMSSKLPDEIKMLMIEHPIQQPNAMGAPSISDELVEKASRLMNVNAKGDAVNQSKKTQSSSSITGVDTNLLKQMVRETMEELLKENGLLIESTTNTNEMFRFRVGEHIFEGKVTKIKKVSK
jgi:hypothetical protein